MRTTPTIYQTKSDIARTFGMSRANVYVIIPKIEEQVKKGRYNQYAICDGQINVGVFADYLKYRKMLEDKNARKYVPAFNLWEALDMTVPEEPKEEIEDDISTDDVARNNYGGK